MPSIAQITKQFEKFAPLTVAEEWDNTGLQAGNPAREVSSVLLALDLDRAALRQAVECGADLVFTHHPFLFKGIKSIDGSDYQGRMLLELIENKIALYSAHTNLDFAPGGLLDLLCAKLGLKDVKRIPIPGEVNGFACGQVESVKLKEFIGIVKASLDIEYLRYSGDLDKVISKVAVCNGGGGDLGELASDEGCDVYVTGDFKYHTAQSAVKDGMAIIDAGHFETEQFFVELVAEFFKREFPSVKVILPENSGTILKTI